MHENDRERFTVFYMNILYHKYFLTADCRPNIDIRKHLPGATVVTPVLLQLISSDLSAQSLKPSHQKDPFGGHSQLEYGKSVCVH